MSAEIRQVFGVAIRWHETARSTRREVYVMRIDGALRWYQDDEPVDLSDDDFDDLLDAEIIAGRLGGGEIDSDGFAAALGLPRSSVRTYLSRGQLPTPRRTERAVGGNRPLWSAEQVAGALIERSTRQPARGPRPRVGVSA